MKRRARLLLAFAAGLVVAAVAIGLLLARDDWNWARPLVERLLERGTGREVEIAGDLRVDFGRWSEVEAQDVRLGNVEGGTARDLFTTRRIALRVRTWPLLFGTTRIDRLEAESTALLLERDAAGRGNWSFGEEPSRRKLVLPAAIRLRDFALSLTDPARPNGFHLRIDELASSGRGALRHIAARGVYQREPFRLQGTMLGIPGRDPGPTPLAARLWAGETRLHALGRLGTPDRAPLVDLWVDAEGESLDDLWRLAGVPLPESPRFDLASRLTYGESVLRLSRLRGHLGKSDLAGNLAFHLPRGGRMKIDADVRSRAVDLDDIEGFWGRPPREEKRRPAVAPAPGTPASIFPDLPFHFPKLRVADARIRFRADRIQGKSVLDDVRLDATLEKGVLRMHPLALGMSAGALETDAVLDARGEVTRLRAGLVIRGVDLEELLARAELDVDAAGEFGGRAELASRGNSLAELARNASGEVGSVLQNGRLSDPALELVALHLGDFLFAKLSDGKKEAPIRCLVGVFDGEQGVLTARTLLMDTPHVRIEGEGTIDLGRERIDLELDQHSKDFSIGALRTPILIEGPLLTRRARLKAGPLAVRGGAAVALGAAIHPLAALLALVDPGKDDKPGACAEALAEYRPIAAEVRAEKAPAPPSRGRADRPPARAPRSAPPDPGRPRRFP